MEGVDYLGFDLLILRSGGGYRALARSPGGEGDTEFVLPDARMELERLIPGARSVATEPPPPRPAPPGGGVAVLPEARAARAAPRSRAALRPTAMASFGRSLFRGVFAGRVGLAYRRSLGLAGAQGRGLRVRLHLADVPELLDLPWELLYDDASGQFVASSNGTPLVRYLDLPRPVEAVPVGGPLRLLVVVSSPTNLPRLDAAAELGRLDGALGHLTGAGRVAVDRLERATLPALVARLREGRHHVLHYIGHGGFDDAAQQGILAFEADDGSAAPVRAEDLADALRGADSLRLVVLNSCEGGRSSVVDPFAGVAQSLVGRGVPAVVAMQFEVTDEAAVGFARGFYSAVAAEAPVDEAVTAGRLAMMTLGDGTEWATPVLYTHADDTRLFAFPWGDSAPGPAPGTGELRGGGRVLTPAFSVDVAPPTGARLDPTETQVVPRARPIPVAMLPPPFPTLLGREAELAAASGTASGAAVEFVADPGWGKTALLRAAANAQVGDAPAGLLYLRCVSMPVADIVQFVFEGLYETDVPFVPDEEQLARWLGGVDAAVVLDDVALGPTDLATLRRLAPGCRLVLGRSPVAGAAAADGTSRVVLLRGVPAEAGVRLVELELGRGLADAERADAARLCDALEGKPARILAEVERAWEQERSLADVVASLAPPPPVAAVPPPMPGSGALPTTGSLGVGAVAELSPEAAGVAGVLVAVHPAPVHADHLVRVVGLTDPVPVLESLQRRGLARAGSPMYALTFTPTDGHRATLHADRWAIATLDHLTAWARQEAVAEEIVRDSDVMLAALAVARGAGRAQQLIELGRAIESPLAAGRRWGQWGFVLGLELEAAAAVGSVPGQAWALHQLGTRAAGRGELGPAREQLTRALELRSTLHDAAGAAATAHNLEVLGGPPVPPRGGRDGGGRGGGPGRLGWVIGGLAAAGLVGLLVFLLVIRGGGSGPARAVVTPTAVDLGPVTLGTGSTLAITVRNAGESDLTVVRISVEPPNGQFRAVSRCGRPLGAGQACPVEVTFAPTTTGPASAVVVIADDTGAGPQRVDVSGTGVTRALPAVTFDPPTVDFGSVSIGGTGTQSVTVTNSGAAPLHVGSSSAAPGQFSVSATTCGAAAIAPGVSCEIEVAFVPSARGPVAGRLVVADDAAGGSQVVALNGAGVTDRPDLVVADLQAGQPVPGDGTVDIPVTFAVRNDGDAPAGTFQVSLEYTGGNIDPARSFFVPFVPAPGDAVTPDAFTTQDLQPGDQVVFNGTVQFNPKEQGATVQLTTVADSCAGIETAPAECRVVEIDEGNNRSDPVTVALFGFTVPTSAPTTSAASIVPVG